MEQHQDTMAMLELVTRPAFCVKDGVIVRVNTAAQRMTIEAGMPVLPLLATGQTEYADFSGGCLYLTLSLAGHRVGASVARMQEFDVFTLEQVGTDAHLQALALAARELREPLSSVMTVTDKLFSAAELDGKELEQAERINRGLFRMLRIIGNMSDASRYSADTGAQLETRDIRTVLEEIFHRATALTEHTEVALHYTGFPESVYTLVDAQKLERMVFNILSNAIKFTPAGGTITAKLTRRGTRMYLSVCDSGSGIADNLRGSIFNRYTREPRLEDGRCGLGLGMVLVRSTAALHGGTVLIDHPQGSGTRITVSFAIRQGNATLRSPKLRIDYAGERDHGLIELSDVLPARLYDPEIVN